MLASSDSIGKNLSIKGYRGMHRFKKQQLPVFMIKLSTQNNAQEMRIFFSKTGDPLMVESNIGIYAISELFTSFDEVPNEEP